MEKILVLGGTGKTGRRVVRRLKAAGMQARTASRTGGDVPFDLGRPETWGPALDGAAAVYIVEPDLRPGLDRRARVPALVAEAVAAGARRLVLLSAHGVGEAGDDHPLKSAEQAVRDSGVGWTILRPDWFAQNFSEAFWRQGILAGALALPTGDGRTPFVDAEDIAEVAAAALTHERHSGRIYCLTGPRAIAFGEAAASSAGPRGARSGTSTSIPRSSWSVRSRTASRPTSRGCSRASSSTSATGGAPRLPTAWNTPSAGHPGGSRTTSPRPPQRDTGTDPFGRRVAQRVRPCPAGSVGCGQIPAEHRRGAAMIAILGTGKMGEALLSGLVRAGLRPDEIVATARRPERAEALRERYGVRVASNAEAAKLADTVILAVKPQDMSALLTEISPHVAADRLVISVAAGITTAFVEARLGDGVAVVRVMSNTPVLVDEAMSVISAGAHASEEHLKRTEELLSPVGKVLRIPESQQDAATALSGSGPAYFFYLVEAMVDAGILLGMPRAAALDMVTQSIVGAAIMLRDSGSTR
ncbi:hypothetical protein GCM10027612_13880 [Microbispora bryophytorum subsp. camponoti]